MPPIRLVLLLAALGYAALSAGFVLRQDWAVALWPWPDGRLSYLFVGSVMAAFAAGSGLAALSGRTHAARSSVIGLAVVYLLAAAVLVAAGAWLHAAVALAVAVAAPALLRLIPRQPDAPLPRLVAASCWVFAAALGVTGAGLLLAVDTIFPWPLSPESSRLFGAAFLGLSTVYAGTAHGRQLWEGRVVMAGFLAYDLILLPPFLMLFSTIAPERLLSLVLYVLVLLYSAVLALLFLGGRLKA